MTVAIYDPSHIKRGRATKAEVEQRREALLAIIDAGRPIVPLMVARGYASLSFLYSAAEYINDLTVPAYIHHLGDFDPSGINAGEKIEETLREMAPDAEIFFERIAVTPEQINEWDLPTRPTKASDSARECRRPPRTDAAGKDAVAKRGPPQRSLESGGQHQPRGNHTR